MRTVTAFTKLQNLQLVYFAYIYSIMSHGTVFWENWTTKYFMLLRKLSESLVEKLLRILAFFHLLVNTYSQQYSLLYMTMKNFE